MKKITLLFLFFWCVNIYGQESITDTTEFSDASDVTSTAENLIIWSDILSSEIIDPPYADRTVTGIIVETYTKFLYPYLDPIWIEFIELYEEYETKCFNDSTKQCFNYYTYLNLIYYKTPCSKGDVDLRRGIHIETGEEWIHVQPSFIGFMQYLKEQRDKN